MIEVRRDDGELCGFVANRGDRWAALTVFGVAVGEWSHEHEARQDVLGRGLALLAERWTLTDATTGESQVACIQHAGPDEVTLALDFYSLPGVPTLTIPSGDLAAGRWTLTPGT
jgi:hypothetical protein